MKRRLPEEGNSGLQPHTGHCNTVRKICFERGLTPRNEPPKKKPNHGSNILETYADKVESNVSCVKSDWDRRFISIEALHNCADKLAYGECAKEVVCETEDEVMKQFREFVESVCGDKENTATISLIDEFVERKK